MVLFDCCCHLQLASNSIRKLFITVTFVYLFHFLFFLCVIHNLFYFNIVPFYTMAVLTLLDVDWRKIATTFHGFVYAKSNKLMLKPFLKLEIQICAKLESSTLVVVVNDINGNVLFKRKEKTNLIYCIVFVISVAGAATPKKALMSFVKWW